MIAFSRRPIGVHDVAAPSEFEAYGYRRVGVAPRHQGLVVNHKEIAERKLSED